MKSVRYGMVAAAAALALFASAACSSKNAPESEKSMDKVTYLSGFGSFGREAFAWVADAKGYFKDAGIDVTIKPGAAGDSNMKLLAADQAQFAIVDYAGTLVRVGKGAGTDFRAVGSIQQRTVVSIMSLPDAGISKPADLQGKTIGVAAGAVPKTLFPAYAKLAGVDASKVKWVESNPQQLPALLVSGKVDAIGQYVVGAPAIQKAAKGTAPSMLPYGDYLTDLYGSILVTSTRLIEKDPDLVKRFRTALLKGLEYSMNHPDETGQILHKAQPAMDAGTAAKEVVLMRPYVVSAAGGVPVGAMESARVARGIALMQSLGLVPSGMTADKIVDFKLTPNKS